MLLSSLAVVRHLWYETFAVLHRLLAATIILAVWLHLPSRKPFTVPSLYLLGATLIWTVTGIFWLISIAYRNIRWGKKMARAKIVKAGDILQAHIRIPRHWDFKAGQYIRLCIPGVSPSAFMQWHPFMISWWYQEGHDMVIVIIIQQRKGFTANLRLHAGPGTGIKAIIDGPYGRELHLSSYGLVLMFASGIGIAGQLPYVRQLLQGFHMCKTNCRRIVLFWEMDLQGNTPRHGTKLDTYS
jgi:predicted ferric reductase